MTRISANKLKARIRIESKIDLLEAWAAAGVPARPDGLGKEFYPMSTRQFNFWDLSENSISIREQHPDFGRSANDTLNQYPHLRSQVETLIVAIRSKEKGGATKLEKIKALKDQLAISKDYTSVLERQLVILRLQNREQEGELRAEIARLQNILNEEKSLFKSVQMDNADLKTRISKLTSTLKKVSPLRSSSDE